MGFREPVRRSTLADANAAPDWRSYAAFAQRLIALARKRYAQEDLGLALTNTVYMLDLTNIDRCLSVFPWALFRSTQSAAKMHTLFDLRGSIPSHLHIVDGKRHDVYALDLLVPEPGAIYVMDRGYTTLPGSMPCTGRAAFSSPAPSRTLDAHRVYSRKVDRATGLVCDQSIALDGFYTQKDDPDPIRRIRFNDPDGGRRWVFLSNPIGLPALTVSALYKGRWPVELSCKWIQQPLRIKPFYGTSENALKTQL